jgi:ZIP family zinc transporter
LTTFRTAASRRVQVAFSPFALGDSSISGKAMVNLDNAGLAFGLVVAAGLSTAIGAAAVYFKSLVQLASKTVLAAGLGFSGGVMLYVSFVEIFVKSQDAFMEAFEEDETKAYYAATGCLFSGMLMLRLMAMLVHALDKNHDHGPDAEAGPQIRSNPVGAGTMPQAPTAEPGLTDQAAVPASPAEQSAVGAKPQDEEASPQDKNLQSMGLKTALAIAIHNFPEGLATFVATLAEPSVGVTLAIAIAIHNIPEGLCVALPIYYATNSRHQGFFWALLSGLSEPIGAGIGYAIIKSTGEDLNQFVYGILFGIVAGMMIMIVLLELLPTALRYDPKDRVVTNSVVLGMVVMALSLVLFIA